LFLKIERDFDRKFLDYKERLMKSWNVYFVRNFSTILKKVYVQEIVFMKL